MTPPRELGSGNLSRRVREDGTAFYLFSYTDADRVQRRKRLGSNKAVAERRAAQIIRERDLILAGLGTAVTKETPWAEVLPQFLAESALNAKASHVRQVEKSIRRILEGIRATRLSQVGLRDVERWRTRRAAEVAPSTVNAECAHLRRFMEWCVPDLLGANPLAGLRRIRSHVTRPPRALTDSEIARLFAAADRLDEIAADRRHAVQTISAGTKGRRYEGRKRATPFPRALVVRFLVKVGCRWGEAASLTWADVRMEFRELQFRAETVKNATARRFPIDDELADLLERIRLSAHATLGRMPRQSDPLLLTPLGASWARGGTANFRRWLLTAYEAAGIPRFDAHGRRIHVHALRHSFATRLLRAGVPIQYVQRLGGWKTITVLERIYNHVESRDALDAMASVPLPPVPTAASEREVGRKSAPRRFAGIRGEGGDSPQPPTRKAVGDGTPDRIRTCDLSLRRRREGDPPESSEVERGGAGGPE